MHRGAALADGTGPELVRDVRVLVDDGRIRWVGPADDEPDPEPDAEVVDCSGAAIVPDLVDSHSHVTMPGGAHWVDRWPGPRRGARAA